MTEKTQLFDLTDDQVYNACLSYRHDYGLMDLDQKSAIEFKCREWARALGKAITPQSANPEGQA